MQVLHVITRIFDHFSALYVVSCDSLLGSLGAWTTLHSFGNHRKRTLTNGCSGSNLTRSNIPSLLLSQWYSGLIGGYLMELALE